MPDSAILNSRLFKVGQTVRHFKGGLYKIVAPIAFHTEDFTSFVVYKSINDEKVWVRPVREFCSEVDREKYPNATQKYRFEILED